MSESERYPYLLVVVEGPSEARPGDDGSRGVVVRLVREVFGAEVASNILVRFWRHVELSPRRSREKTADLKTVYAQKAYVASKVGDRTTAYGTVIVIDNDHTGIVRIQELCRGIDASGSRGRVAVGVARETIEAWVLADRELLAVPIPVGKGVEELWGDRHDPLANHPKHALHRCVLAPREWHFPDAVERWEPSRARPHARSLDEFIGELQRLATSQGVT